ncbi:MAG: lytic transglycosylase domain-containing protein [Xanthomonadaceae bacterium]|nr:lytic transglycosylase domain-containing protein [Xanthomonadaceae bacterium]
MRWNTSTLLMCAMLGAGCAGHREASPSSNAIQADASRAAATDPQARSDAALKAAIDAASRGQLDAATRASIQGQPAAAWADYARLRRDIDMLAPEEAEAFLRAHPDDAVGRSFREDWLAALSRRQDWTGFIKTWRPTIERASLRCMALNARNQIGQGDAAWMQDVRRAWLSGKSVSAECDPAFAAWQAKCGLDDALRWQRIDLAIDEGQPALIRAIAQGLPEADRVLADSYAAAMTGGLAQTASQWPRTARSRSVATAALVATAKKSPANGEAAFATFAAMIGLDDAQRGRVLYEIALQSAASYEPEGARRLAAVPVAAYDERLHGLRLREAMARSDWAGAREAIRRMPASMRHQPQYRYFDARLIELTGGDPAAARAQYAEAAKSPEFHGFLAADRLGSAYPLCPWPYAPTSAQQAQVAAMPALQRALALYRIGQRDWAMREWNDALKGLDDAGRHIAIAQAQDSGWFDRAVFNLGRDGKPEELRLYTLRFPLHHTDTIRREAQRNAIDPAWIAAEIRAESVFDPRARSPANAMGLMQVLPATGQATAAKIGLPWRGAEETLFDPDSNIAIGSAYLREMHEKWGDLPHAIAAYNAGPTPTTRWRTQRPDFDPDLWIETISYKETRDYVARVLAFSVIYDWRMNGDALRVSDRIEGKLDAKRVGFACPQPAAR